MLANVLPGLRELRAPLTAGYLWLLWCWLVWGDALPDQGRVKGPFARLYELAPVVSAFGLAVVASVVAYVVGSVAIDVGVVLGGWIATRVRRVGIHLGTKSFASPLYWKLWGNTRLRRLLFDRRSELPGGPALEPVEQQIASENSAFGGPLFTEAIHRTLDGDRNMLKTRLLDASATLHSEVDRPDAEATFRMGLWPPVAAIVLYMGFAVSTYWLVALVVPALVIWQWQSLRREANDALATAIASKPDLETFFTDQLRPRVREELDKPDPVKASSEAFARIVSAMTGTEEDTSSNNSEQAPASSGGPTAELPITDGDWRLDSIRVNDDGLGDFGGTGRVTYTGDDPAGGINLFTVTVFVNGKDVAALEGQRRTSVEPGRAATVRFISQDKFVKGPYKYDFQRDL